ncbi:MAG: hypothetical protein ACPF8V_05580 [Luteibaculum sp.]
MRILFFLLVALLSLNFSAFAGPSLGDKVFSMISRIDSCASADQVDAIINEYKDITYEFGTDWRSYYWMAYANLKKAEYCFDKTRRDKALEEGLNFIKRARLIKRDQDEIDLLEALLLLKKIEIDPENRKNKYIFTAKELLNSAYAEDQLNPRYYYIKGWQAVNDTLDNPGNRDKAESYFRSAEKLFGTHDKNLDLADPNWGFEDTQLYLNVLIPSREFYFNKSGERVETMLDVESEMELKDIEKELKKQEKATKREAKKESRGKSKKEDKPEEEEDVEEEEEKKKEKSKGDKEEKKEKKKKVRNLP